MTKANVTHLVSQANVLKMLDDLTKRTANVLKTLRGSSICTRVAAKIEGKGGDNLGCHGTELCSFT